MAWEDSRYTDREAISGSGYDARHKYQERTKRAYIVYMLVVLFVLGASLFLIWLLADVIS